MQMCSELLIQPVFTKVNEGWSEFAKHRRRRQLRSVAHRMVQLEEMCILGVIATMQNPHHAQIICYYNFGALYFMRR